MEFKESFMGITMFEALKTVGIWPLGFGGKKCLCRAVHTLGLQNKKAWHKTMRRLRGSRDLVWLDHGRVERELQRQV